MSTRTTSTAVIATVLVVLALGQGVALVGGLGSSDGGSPPVVAGPASEEPTVVLPPAEAPTDDGSAPGKAAEPGKGGFPGWDAIKSIYYEPGQDNRSSRYVAEAASELKTQLELVRPSSFSVTTSDPGGPAVRLAVRPAEVSGSNPDAFKLSTGSDGVTVVGETPLAARHGMYTLLDSLGFRWYFPHPAWSVAPDSLTNVALDGEVQAPAYQERKLVTAPGFLQATDDGTEVHRLWRARNRLDSDVEFETRHSYDSFAPLDEITAQYPDAVCKDANGKTRNVRPTAPVVVERANAFADQFLAKATSGGDVAMAAPISPNDGGQTCPEWRLADGKLDFQKVTDDVFSLTNGVAKHLQATRPGKYASVLSYNTYSVLPSTPLEPNVFVMVTSALGVIGSELTLQERLEGFRDRGVKTGVYEYLNVWQYTHDRPYAAGKMAEKLASISSGARAGATVSVSEAGDNWGAKGRAYWMASRLFWSPGAKQEDLLDDFYALAFGPARAPVERYFDRIDANGLTDHRAAMADLEEALRIATGTPVEERVRQLILFTHYDWRWGAGIADDYALSAEETKALYAEVWRLTNLHLITVKPEKGAIAKALREKHGLSAGQIAGLEDKAAPSPDEVRQRLGAVLRG